MSTPPPPPRVQLYIWGFSTPLSLNLSNITSPPEISTPVSGVHSADGRTPSPRLISQPIDAVEMKTPRPVGGPEGGISEGSGGWRAKLERSTQVWSLIVSLSPFCLKGSAAMLSSSGYQSSAALCHLALSLSCRCLCLLVLLASFQFLFTLMVVFIFVFLGVLCCPWFQF